MITMCVKGWKYETGVTVEVKDVGVKYYNFKENIADNLYKRFKTDQPNKILFVNNNAHVEMFIDKIIDEGYIIDSNGYIQHDWINQVVEEKDQQECLKLEFENEYDQLHAAQLLLKNHYVVSISSTGHFYRVHATKEK